MAALSRIAMVAMLILPELAGIADAAAPNASPKSGTAPPPAPAPSPPQADDLPAAIAAAIEGAKAFLFSLQRDQVLLLIGEASDPIVVNAKWEDVSVDAANRSVSIKGRRYFEVYAVLPPGWFGSPAGAGTRTGGETFNDVTVGGHTALITLALLSARVEPDREPRLKAALECLLNMRVREYGRPKRGKPDTNVLLDGPTGTYAIGLRAAAFHAALRSLRPGLLRTAIEKALIRDAKVLAAGFGDGGFGYIPTAAPGHAWDQSNTQYGVLGLRAAAEEPGSEFDEDVWDRLESLLLKIQNKDGGWGYVRGTVSRPAMTAAALASLFAVGDQLRGRQRGAEGPQVSPVDPDSPARKAALAAERGLASLGRNFRQKNNKGYFLYAAERVGEASGFKRFGGCDWFREGAEAILSRRRPDGSLSEPNPPDGAGCETAWSLLFLVRGGAPVLLNKLRYGPADDDQWDNYPRDCANLCAWHSRRFEQDVGWQIVSLGAGRDDDLDDAPILFISGFRAFTFTDAEVGQIRRYVERGGTLLLAACGDQRGRRFVESAGRLAERLYPPADFPEYRLTALPPDHPVVTQDPETEKAMAKLEIRHAHNGSRSWMFVIAEDLGHVWNRNRPADRPEAFALIANLRRYCRDKGALAPKVRPARVAAGALVDGAGPKPGEVTVGVVRYQSGGRARLGPADEVAAKADWASAPNAWAGTADWFERTTGRRVRETRGVSLAGDKLADFGLLHMTGRYAFTLTAEEIAALKAYLSAGGTLLLEQAAGRDAEGRRGFHESALQLAAALFPEAPAAPVPPDHPLFTGRLAGTAGVACGELGWSRSVALLQPGDRLPLRVVTAGGRAVIVLSPYDLSCALAGENCWGREGFAPAAARVLAANILLSAQAGRAAK